MRYTHYSAQDSVGWGDLFLHLNCSVNPTPFSSCRWRKDVVDGNSSKTGAEPTVLVSLIESVQNPGQRKNMSDVSFIRTVFLTFGATAAVAAAQDQSVLPVILPSLSPIMSLERRLSSRLTQVIVRFTKQAAVIVRTLLVSDQYPSMARHNVRVNYNCDGNDEVGSLEHKWPRSFSIPGFFLGSCNNGTGKKQ